MRKNKNTTTQRRQDISVGGQNKSILLDWRDDNVSVEDYFSYLLWWWVVLVGGRSSPWVEADFEAVTAGLAGRNGH